MDDYIFRSKDFGFEKIREEIASHEELMEIGCLMASFAHEINNPLGFVISNLETLTSYLTKYKEIIREIGSINRDRNNKIKRNFFVSLSYLEKIVDNNLDFIYNDIDNLLTETKEGIKRIKNTVDSIKNFARLNNKDNFRKIDLNMCIDKALLLAKMK